MVEHGMTRDRPFLGSLSFLPVMEFPTGSALTQLLVSKTPLQLEATLSGAVDRRWGVTSELRR